MGRFCIGRVGVGRIWVFLSGCREVWFFGVRLRIGDIYIFGYGAV